VYPKGRQIFQGEGWNSKGNGRYSIGDGYSKGKAGIKEGEGQVFIKGKVFDRTRVFQGEGRYSRRRSAGIHERGGIR